MGWNVVGSVALKVVPDTRGFKEKVKSQLSDMDDKIKDKIEVKPEVDKDKFRSDLEKELEDLSRGKDNRSKIVQHITTALDDDGIQKKFDKLLANMQRRVGTDPTFIKVIPDENGAKKAADKLLDKVKSDVNKNPLTLKAQLDKGYRETLSKAHDELAKSLDLSHSALGLDKVSDKLLDMNREFRRTNGIKFDGTMIGIAKAMKRVDAAQRRLNTVDLKKHFSVDPSSIKITEKTLGRIANMRARDDLLGNIRRTFGDMKLRSNADSLAKDLKSISDAAVRMPRMKIDLKNVDVDRNALRTKVDEAVGYALKNVGKGTYNEKIKIPVEVDPEGRLSKWLKQQKAGFKAVAEDSGMTEFFDHIKNQVAKLNKLRIKIKTDLDVSDIDKTKLLAQRAFDEQTFKVRPDLDNSALERLKRRLQTAFIKLSHDVEMKIKARPDASSLAETKLALKKMLGSVQMKLAPPAKFLAEVASTIKTASLKDVVVNIKAKYDSKSFQNILQTFRALSGQRVHWDLIRPGIDTLKSFDRISLKLAAISTAMGGVATVGLHAGGVILGVAGDLVKLAGAALPLPGVLMGIGASVHIMVSALGDLTQQVPAIRKGLDDMTKASDRAFWNTAKKPITDMTNRMIPDLIKGYDKLGGALGSWSGKLADSLKLFVAPQIPSFFNSLTRATVNAGGFATSMGRVTASFMQIATRYIPSMGKGLSDVTTKFANWLSKAVSSGKAFEWVGEAVHQIKLLGVVAMSTIRVFSGITKAAQAAGFGLDGFAKGMSSLATTVNRSGVQKQLVGVFTATSKAAQTFYGKVGPAFSKTLNGIANLLQKSLPDAAEAAGTAISAFLDGLADDKTIKHFQNMISSIRDGVDKIAPHLTNLGKTMGVVGEAAGHVFDNMAPLIGRALDAALPVVEGAAHTLDQVTKNMAGGMTKVVDSIQPLVNKGVPAVSKFASSLSKDLGDALTNMSPHIKNLSTSLGNMLDRVLPKAAPVLGEAAKHFADLASGGIDLLAHAIKLVIPPLEKLFGFLGRHKALTDFAVDAVVVGAAFKGWKTAFGAGKKAYDNVKNAIQAGKDTFVGLKDIIRKLGGKGGAATDAASAMDGLAKNTKKFGSSAEGAKGATSDLIGTTGGKAGIVGLAAALASLEGHLNKVSLEKAFGKDKASKIIDWETIFSPPGIGPLLTGKLEQNLQQIFSGVNWGRVWNGDMLGNFIITVKTKITNGFKDAGNWLKDAGQAILQGLLDGMKAKFGDWIQPFIDRILPWIKEHKGPESTDAVALFPNGQAIMQGLLDGMKSVWTSITGWISGILSQIQSMFSAGVSACGAAISAAAAGIQSAWTTVTNWLSSKASSAWAAIKSAFSSGTSAVQSAVSNAGSQIASAWSSMQSSITSTASSAWSSVRSTFAAGASAVQGATAAAKARIASTWSSMKSSIISTASSAWSSVRSIFSSGSSAVQSATASARSRIASTWSSMRSAITSTTSSAWSSVRSTFSSGANSAANTANSLRARASSAMSSMSASIRSIAQSAWSGVRSAFQSGVSNAARVAGGIAGRVRGAVGNLGGTLYGAGRSLIQGLVNGMQSMLGVVSGIASQARAAAASAASAVYSATSLFIPRLVTSFDADGNDFSDTPPTFRSPVFKMFGAAFGGDTFDDSKMVDVGMQAVAPMSLAASQPQTLSSVMSDFSKALTMPASTARKAGASWLNDYGEDGGNGSLNGTTINVTNNYPQAEPTSTTVNKALQMATLF